MPPPAIMLHITDHAGLGRGAFDRVTAPFREARTVADLARFASAARPPLRCHEVPAPDGHRDLVLSRPSGDLSFSFRVTDLSPDARILSGAIRARSPSLSA